jgi:hypothetical protein
LIWPQQREGNPLAAPKRIRSATHSRHRIKLDCPRAIAMEQGRVYRLGLNGKIAMDEMSKLIYGLKEVRCSLESVIDREMPPQPAPEAPSTSVVNVCTVPEGCFVRDVGANYTIEHEAPAQLSFTPSDPEAERDVIQDELAPVAESVAAPIVQAAIEPDPIMARALALGYTPLPPRPFGGRITDVLVATVHALAQR